MPSIALALVSALRRAVPSALSALALVLFFAPSALPASESAVDTVDPIAVGEPLELVATTEIGDILDHPERHDGERVRVAGRVVGVCAAKGCWMDIQDDGGRQIQIKVEDDGPLVFPQEATGHDAVVEGRVELLPMERDRYVAHQRHMADDAGEEFDEASIGDGPYRVVRLRGLGAEIEMASGASSGASED